VAVVVLPRHVMPFNSRNEGLNVEADVVGIVSPRYVMPFNSRNEGLKCG